ncbi:hypothetical protein HanXRQr2_Chr15g0675181 [Helianthus annuus]|uniref:Uncharacterized protein n=1 Tax=Helianthus annuus TaxID=4232 RepID=A0A9K3DWT0_HELAN|nr:hypothetical protein HanXRQr2_Chr15g0675181 [Helianthus annuus]
MSSNLGVSYQLSTSVSFFPMLQVLVIDIGQISFPPLLQIKHIYTKRPYARLVAKSFSHHRVR